MKSIQFARMRYISAAVFAFILLTIVVAFVLPKLVFADAYPNSMAATGDSITRAYNTGKNIFADAPANSWATGTTTSVNSLYNRIVAVNPAITDKYYNDAKSGTKMVDLNAQMSTVAAQAPEYVTVMMGANDVCTSATSTMTSVQDYHDQFLNAMNTLTTSLPNTKVFVSSIPNVYQLWNLEKGNSSARFAWAIYGICKSMLANPTSIAQVDVTRRAFVLQRETDFNTQLQQVCSQFANCVFDNNTAFNYSFVTSDINTRDYFHPSLSGQATVARVLCPVSGLGLVCQ